MPIVEIKAVKGLLPANARLIGIDQGEKTWGLAVSTPDLSMALPLKTIQRTKFTADLPKLAAICKEYGVKGFIIGLPVNMDGTEGPRCESVRHFAQNIIERQDLLGFDPVIAFWDERLSTSAVNRALISEADTSRKKRAKLVDQSAAAWILQGAIDFIKNQ